VQEAVVSYFAGEKHGAVLLILIGLAALVAAAALFQPRWELRSFAITLGMVALLEIALGVGLYVRTGPQVAALLAQLGSNAPAFLADEGARMVRVQRNFVVVHYVEIAVIVIAAVIAFAQRNRFWIAGIALAFLFHAGFLLAFDIVAERRGAAYLARINQAAEANPERRLRHRACQPARLGRVGARATSSVAAGD
jgi:hypothetical protein